MNNLSDFYKDLPNGRCHPCEFAKYVGTWEGWGFLGCYHPPYTGKRVCEIKNCPICGARMERDEE